MFFYIFTSIVFIAELIITFALLTYLFKINKALKEYNALITELNPKISDLLKTFAKISEQMIEFAPIITENIKSVLINLVIGQLKSALGGLVFWLVKKEVEKQAAK